jgi:hypothetical protein
MPWSAKEGAMANRPQLYEYKGGRCAHCAFTVREMVQRYGTVDRMFEFNHVDPAEKHPDYTNVIRRVLSSEQLDEVDKCVLLCRQCHGILHAQGLAGRVQFTVNVAGQTATQTLNGQLILDMKERRAKFLTNERVLVVPYRLQIGDQEPKLYFGTALEKEGVLLTHFRNLPQIRRLRVMAYRSDRVLLDVEHVGGNKMKMMLDVSFPVLTSELCGDGEDGPMIWLRNGVGLTKDGEVIYNGTVTCEGTIVGV